MDIEQINPDNVAALAAWHATVVAGSRLHTAGICSRHGIILANFNSRPHLRAVGRGTGPVVVPAYVPRLVDGRIGGEMRAAGGGSFL